MSTFRRTWKGPRTRPAALPDAAIYVLWRYGSTPNGKGKYPKIPYTPHKIVTEAKPRGTYKGAKTDNPATWGTFAECIAAAADWRGWFDGVGMVLQPGMVGIDLDDGIDPADAKALLDASAGRAYQEQSVSGKGNHIIVLGHIADAIKTDAIEIYPGGEGKGRYFALGTEVAGSATPGDAQRVVDQAVTLSGTQPRSSVARASLRLVETVALTAELSGELRAAQAELPQLLHDVPANLTVQLADLLYRNVFPPAMKDTSASGARAVVVAQLHRAPKQRYSDAQIYVLARELWRRKGWEGAMAGTEKALAADAWRLIALYRPGAPPKSAPAKRRYQDAPDPLVYLARLAEEAAGNMIPLTRDERAAVVGCTRATAQRVEEQMVKDGLITLKTYALHGGMRGRRGAIKIEPAGFAALRQCNESVIQSEIEARAANEQVKSTASPRHKPQFRDGKNTLLCDRGHSTAPPPQPRVLTAFDPPADAWKVPDPTWDGIEDEIIAWERSPEGQRALRWEASRHRLVTGLSLAQWAVMRAAGLEVEARLGLDTDPSSTKEIPYAT